MQPLKKLGQNFLIDETILKKIMAVANIQKQDVILEIGPGLGVLTEEIAKKAKQVIAVEKDPRMVKILKETFNGFDNVKTVQDDILKFLSGSHLDRKTINKVVANLPYYIVAPVIRKFLEAKHGPKEMVLMVQKEVAQRICARPPRMNILAVSVQFYAQPEIISYVSKKSFWPQPKVDGAIIKITPLETNRFSTIAEKMLFFKIVKAGFAHPRKQLTNNLSTGLKIDKEKTKTWLLKNKIQPSQRAQTLTVENWLRLTKHFMLR